MPFKGFDLHPVVETTFLRKDRVRQRTPRADLAHPLDFANTSELIDFPLDPAWS